MNLPQSLQNTINSLSNLPGIGSRSAERLAFNLLRNKSGLAQTLGEHLTVLQENVVECNTCCNYADNQAILVQLVLSANRPIDKHMYCA
jgi:recombination protein RecR